MMLRPSQGVNLHSRPSAMGPMERVLGARLSDRACEGERDGAACVMVCGPGHGQNLCGKL